MAYLNACVHSYRLVGGSDFPQLLKVCFQKVGFVLDADYLRQCQFDEELWKRINAAKKGHAPADVQPVLRMNAIPWISAYREASF